jgi:hypothetical protein
MSSTFKNIPTAAEYAERITWLLSQISRAMGNQAVLLGMANDRCEEDSKTPEQVAALVHSIDALNEEFAMLVNVNLRDTVALLLERVKDLEVPHV